MFSVADLRAEPAPYPKHGLNYSDFMSFSKKKKNWHDINVGWEPFDTNPGSFITIFNNTRKHTNKIRIVHMNRLKSIVHTIDDLFVHSVAKIERTFSSNIRIMCSYGHKNSNQIGS